MSAAGELASRPHQGRQAAVGHILHATCFRQQIAQGRLSAAARINARWWEFQQRMGKRSLSSDCQHARPTVQGRLAGGGSQTGRHFTRPGRGEFSQESRRLRSKSPAHFHTHHDELAPASCRHFRVCIPPFSGGRSGDRVAGDAVGAGTRLTIARYRRDQGVFLVSESAKNNLRPRAEHLAPVRSILKIWMNVPSRLPMHCALWTRCFGGNKNKSATVRSERA